MQKRSFFIMISIVVIFIICFVGEKGENVEKLGIPVGVGTDIEITPKGAIYNSSYLIYSFEESEEISNDVLKGVSINIPGTRENRQLKAGYEIIIGLSRMYIYSEDTARYGIRNFLDVNLNSAELNDRALTVVCKGKAEDILKVNVNGYPNSVEFIEGMVKNLRQYNFFPMQYTTVDLNVRADAEGRNIVLPYIEMKNGNLETTGLAIFRGDKMVGKADMDETKIINILKEDKVNGMFTLQQDENKYINCYTSSRRKVSCYKTGEKYNFLIDLNLKGNIVSNSQYKGVGKNIEILKDYEEDMKSYIEKQCNETINNIKCEYETDVLGLGKYAAAKYGRGTGTDWNKVICNSDIQVNVKFSVDTEGKGEY